ncbi:unnamed protein product [Ambrosiozyma monospora]|uniref:Unnamed protein product n=1 Tax=Ambrosiozyma monospora TaxID=43982 RepID=A0ACB5U9M0_AMBMO|nr:unnamed protein product [Ambrosiozyma monospora]
MSNIEDRLLHYFPFEEYEEGQKNFLKLNNDHEDIPQHFYDQWKKFRDDDKLKLTLVEKNQHELAALVREKLKPTVPEVLEAFEELPIELQYEFGKYLLAYFHGGLYVNENSIVLRPFRDWYFSRLFETGLIVGISVDDNEEDWHLFYTRRMKFTNKCFYAKRHHPFLAKLIAKITYLVHQHKKDLQKMTYREMQKKTDESGESLLFSITGESIFTDTLFD